MKRSTSISLAPALLLASFTAFAGADRAPSHTETALWSKGGYGYASTFGGNAASHAPSSTGRFEFAFLSPSDDPVPHPPTKPSVSHAGKPAPAERIVTKSEPELKGTARVVVYNERDIIPIRARLRYTTVIQLPQGEQIMDYVIGDKEFWIVNGSANLAYVKPAKAAATTNLNLVTTRGIVYSFVLAEVGESGIPDLKLFIQSGDEAMSHALNSPPKYVPVEQIEDYRQQAEIARTQVKDAKQAAQTAIENQVSAFKSTYQASLHFGYRFERGKKPFDVTAIF